MDPDVRASAPGVCPRCGMRLVFKVPERKEYPLEISQNPERLQAGDTVRLTLRVLDPDTRQAVKRFDIVHEKLLHLFVVSEDLEFFAHVHPIPQNDGGFVQELRLPSSGMYRLLADFYPSDSVPQLALGTLFVSGSRPTPHVTVSLAPSQSVNLTASLRTDPVEPLAGLETKLLFTLDPASGLEPYLGAWAHMVIASSDLIDLLHLHPFLADGKSVMQFNVVFPRTGLYRIWTQFQRLGEVNTTVFTVSAKAL